MSIVLTNQFTIFLYMMLGLLSVWYFFVVFLRRFTYVFSALTLTGKSLGIFIVAFWFVATLTATSNVTHLAINELISG